MTHEQEHNQTSSRSSSPSWKAGLVSSLKNPATLFAVFILLVIVIAGAILFMVLVGMVKIEDPVQKAAWVEISSQVLNACFTLNALLVLSPRFQLTKWTWRWSAALKTHHVPHQYENAKLIYDMMPAIQLQGLNNMPSTDSVSTTVSGKTASGDEPALADTDNKNHTRESMSFVPSPTPAWKWYTVLAMLHGQWIFQIPITVAMWAYASNPDTRPSYIIPLFLPLSFGTGAVAGIWPLLIAYQAKKSSSPGQNTKPTTRRRKRGDSKSTIRHSIVPDNEVQNNIAVIQIQS